MTFPLDIRPDVAKALRERRPVVALESTLIAHGLPRPLNRETAFEAEAAVRAEGAVPATIAVWNGVPTVGLGEKEITALAEASGVLKASTRDLACAMVGQRTAATTVAATMRLAHRAGIPVFATGGLGGVHRGATTSWDISADLIELGKTPVAVVCAGAKSILDLRLTLELLETQGVPVVGFGTDDFPGFYVRSRGLPVPHRVDTPGGAAAILAAHWQLGGAGVVLAQPVEEGAALSAEDFEAALEEAEERARARNLAGPQVTPFLLTTLAEITSGRTLHANRALIIANARLAAQVASALMSPLGGGTG